MNLKEALKLYDLLGEYLPEGDELTIEFIGTIVHNIQEDAPHIFIDVLSLMTRKDADELLEFHPEFSLRMFVESMIVNDFLGLVQFCRKISYA